MITDAQTIAVVEVTGFDRAQGVVTVKERVVLKGRTGDTPLTHHVAENEQAIIPRAIVQWAAPGARAVVFSSARTSIVCLGQAWYQLKLANQWKLH